MGDGGWKGILTIGVILILTVFGTFVVFNYMLSSTVHRTLPYNVSEKDAVCEKMVKESRFTDCEYGLSDSVIRVCQDFGNRVYNETNSTVNFKYCEDYRFVRLDDNFTILRVR